MYIHEGRALMQAQEAVLFNEAAFMCTYHSFCGAAVEEQKISNSLVTPIQIIQSSLSKRKQETTCTGQVVNTTNSWELSKA